MIRYAFGFLLRTCTQRGRKDIADMLRAKRYAALTDVAFQGYTHGWYIDRRTYRIEVVRPPEFKAGKFILQVQTSDGRRVIGTILRQRPLDPYLDNPTYQLAWA